MHARASWTIVLAGLLLVACSDGRPPAAPSPLFDDATLDAATRNIASSVDPVAPSEVRDAGTVAGTATHVAGEASARFAPSAVLPEAEGVIIFTRHDPSAADPWAVILFDLTTEETLEVYRGQREVQSVAIDGDDTAVLAARATTDPGSDLDVFRADLQAGVVARLTDSATDERNVSSSTDGTRVAWEAEHGGERVAAWRDFAAGTAHRLDTGDAQVQPSLSGNGKLLAFVHQRPAGGRTVSVFDVDDQVLLEVRESTSQVRHPSASDDGQLVAWTEKRSNRDVARLGRAGPDVVEDALDEPGGLHHLHLADSGRWMAYSVTEGGSLRLHTHDVQTGGTEPGPTGAGEERAAYWRLSYDCTVTASGLAAADAGLRPTGLTCDSE